MIECREHRIIIHMLYNYEICHLGYVRIFSADQDGHGSRRGPGRHGSVPPTSVFNLVVSPGPGAGGAPAHQSQAAQLDEPALQRRERGSKIPVQDVSPGKVIYYRGGGICTYKLMHA